ncbi:MAG: uroporphyrinogen-III synthase, partial [Chloroflexota bacterium]|nr:uroporphyrinogen-III synthase [Chloroflexota bacterium]
TESAARDLGLAPDFRPSRADNEALGDELPVPRGAIVLARSDRATPELVERLRARGARVRDVVAYRTSVAAATLTTAAARQACQRGAYAVLSSPSGVDGFTQLVGIEAARRCGLIAIGPTTAARIRQVVEREPRVAARPENDAILAAIGSAIVPAIRDVRSSEVSA